MIKQWKNENLGVTFFFLPNGKNEILTSDGVLIPYDEFKTMPLEAYNAKKNINGGYDYTLSRQSERLVKKALHTKDEQPSDETSVKSTIIDSSNIIPPMKKDDSKKKIKNKKNKEFNLFDFAYPKLMMIVVIICSCLSISFTKTYMLRLQSLPIAYAISSSILIYGIIGMQISRRSWRAKKYLQSFMFGITSISVLLFSMFSALDVNYAKFKESHRVVEQEYNVDNGKKLSYDLCKEELADNKKQIENLNKDIEFQQTQWVLVWDNVKKQNIAMEGRITTLAQDKIAEDKVRIKELDERNQELNEKLREYAESGISVEKTESKTERAKSLTDLIGAMIGVSGNVVQLIILLIPSIFTDLINILGTTIYVDSFEKKKKLKR